MTKLHKKAGNTQIIISNQLFSLEKTNKIDKIFVATLVKTY